MPSLENWGDRLKSLLACITLKQERKCGRKRYRQRGERKRMTRRVCAREIDQIRMAEWLGTVTLVWEVCGSIPRNGRFFL